MLVIQIFRKGKKTGEVVLGTEHFPAIIGRSSKAGVRIEDRAVSRQHAQISMAGDRLVLTDLGTRNGTHVGKRPIETKVIEHKDEATIGEYKLLFQLEAKMKATRPSSPYDEVIVDDGEDMTMRMSRTKVKEVVSRTAKEKPARLMQLSTGREIPLKAIMCFIGSGATCDIIVSGWGIAPKHALLMKQGLSWRVYDLTGRRRVTVDGEQVDSVKLVDRSRFALSKKHIFELIEGEDEDVLTDAYKEWFNV